MGDELPEDGEGETPWKGFVVGPRAAAWEVPLGTACLCGLLVTVFVKGSNVLATFAIVLAVVTFLSQWIAVIAQNLDGQRRSQRSEIVYNETSRLLTEADAGVR